MFAAINGVINVGHIESRHGHNQISHENQSTLLPLTETQQQGQ